MIIDGKWKRELKQLSYAILIWRRMTIFDNLAEHRLNRAILYSATILRKIIEDEAETEAIAKKEGIALPKQKTVHASLEAIKYPYTGEEGWTIRSKLCASDYGKGQNVFINSKDVCNWLLHSYVWGVAQNENGKGFAGFLVASDFDKEKFVHFVSFEEWNALLKVVMKNSIL